MFRIFAEEELHNPTPHRRIKFPPRPQGNRMKTETFDSLPEEIRHQIQAMSQAPEMPQGNDLRERLAENWTEKFELFKAQTKLLDMTEAASLPASDLRGLIALTYSGSLISLGPRLSTGRWLEYVSISLRSDVPDMVSGQGVHLKDSVSQNEVMQFDKGPIQATSAVYRIALCGQEIGVDEQDRRIREAAIFLTHSFMKINRSLSEPGERGAEQFTLKGMAQYIARKNDLTIELARRVLDDFLSTVETGLLLGERVSLGRLGTLSLKVRPAQKARIVKNPLTKEDILVSAKPESPVPRLSVSSALKDKAAAVDPARLE